MHVSRKAILRSVDDPLERYGSYFANITVLCPEWRD
jgi:hypothetical protein